jgi:hypothetical protein
MCGVSGLEVGSGKKRIEYHLAVLTLNLEYSSITLN